MTTIQNLIIIVAVLFLAIIPTTGLLGADSRFGRIDTPIPEDLCKAAVTYLAEIDSLKGIEPKSLRVQRYATIKAKLEPLLQKYKDMSLAKDMVDYAKYTELVYTQEATSPDFLELVGKTLKIRSSILGRCSSFTLNR